jgi:hypothetical protein
MFLNLHTHHPVVAQPTVKLRERLISKAPQKKYTQGIIGHVKWVPYRHSIVYPQVPDGGDSLQIWWVVVNIMNTQLQTANRGWPSSLGVGQRANNAHHKTFNLLRYVPESRRS